MPAEVHRFGRRLGPRDRWFLLLVGLALVAAAVAIALGTRGSEAASPARCVTIEHAGFMGAAQSQYCDAGATAFCRDRAGSDSKIAERCARLDRTLRP